MPVAASKTIFCGESSSKIRLDFENVLINIKLAGK